MRVCEAPKKFGIFRKAVRGWMGQIYCMYHDDCGDGWGRFLHGVLELSQWVDEWIKVKRGQRIVLRTKSDHGLVCDTLHCSIVVWYCVYSIRWETCAETALN